MIRRWLRFNTVSAVGVVLQLALVTLFARLLLLGPLIATALAVETVVIHNFVWHHRWTWAERGNVPAWPAFMRFQFTNGLLSVAANVALVHLFGKALGWNVTWANLAAIAVCGIANFVSAEFLVFTPPTDRSANRGTHRKVSPGAARKPAEPRPEECQEPLMKTTSG